MNSFSSIIDSPAIEAALTRLGITVPTPVQQETIPAAVTGSDLIVQARTGSGKTLAFSIPLLQALEKKNDQFGTFAIILTPTRELAVQIQAAIRSISSDIAPACLIGGVSIKQQLKELDIDRRIIVGTPGRVLDHIQQRTILLRKCQYFVLDEADEMLSMDFLEPITEILSRLPSQRQGLFVSATITPRVESLARSFLKDPKRIIIDIPSEDRPSIRHRYCEVGGELTAKMTALCDILETENPTSAIIFCNTKSDTEIVEKFLRRRGFDARCLNSDLNQKQRDFVMAKIRARELRYLIGTDIAARGIDIEQIDLVVNYALPQDSESYVHRTGRTGRAGRAGQAISLVGPVDFMPFNNLKRALSLELEKFAAPSESEVLEARVSRFTSLLEKEGIDVHARDVVLAEELLRRHGLAAPGIEASTLVAKLSRFMLDHLFNFEANTLEEEMSSLNEAKGQQSSQDGQPKGRERSGSGDRDRNRRRNSRGNRNQRSGRQ